MTTGPGGRSLCPAHNEHEKRDLMTFRAWLRAHCNDDTPIGDIAREILTDRDFPRGAVTEQQIINHMRTMNASELAEDCALAAFAEHQQQQAKDAAQPPAERLTVGRTP